ncbi:MAG: HAD family hydrolase [Elusimicrobia bacterium]|nr:HAD family hydrolase [Elusimicrobiota bacterium]
MARKFDNIIFDLDGTLVDSSGDIGDCLALAFSGTTGVGAFSRLEKAWLGLPLKEIVSAASPGLPAERARAVCLRFREIYDASEYPRTGLMPGSAAALAALAGGGKALFVATNKPLKPTLRIAGQLKISPFFREIACPDMLAGRQMTKSGMLAFLIDKWGLEPSATLMVGDTEPDVAAARANALGCAYYAAGYGGRELGRALRPDILLEDMGLLPSLL